MTTGTFGDHLKREREMRGVSLDEISAATRISTRFLAALENEQWDRLPGGIFNRGFVRATAHFLGLDEESLLAEYSLAVGERGDSQVWSGAGFPPSARTSWITWVLAVVLGILLAGGAWSLWRRHMANRVVNQASAPQAALPNPASIAATNASSSSSDTGAPGNPADPAALELKLEAGRSTTVTVVADGKTVFDGTIHAGENQQFKAREQFDVAAGDSSALLLELNGQMLPPLGAPGQPGKTTLTRKDLKKTSGGPD